MTINYFQKNLLFTLAVTFTLGGIGYTCYVIRANIIERREKIKIAEFERKEKIRIADAKERVARVMGLNVCSHFSDGERARLDKVDTNPEETKRILLEIHRDRTTTWMENGNRAAEQMNYWNTPPHVMNNLFFSFKRSAQNNYQTAMNFAKSSEQIENHDTSSPLK